ncbi:hypothetical protein SZN_09421 [Streptomyces zinciresistens K42]|uniref:Uncharacterized protein n=1 Tax=Streptomyces zinciresistens K42 TaxID=700597 RepID=G2G8R6_9ACTN|nr:hypothetical protein SZN_09421 [Streptomyces zinciresistens K42]
MSCILAASWFTALTVVTSGIPLGHTYCPWRRT